MWRYWVIFCCCIARCGTLGLHHQIFNLKPDCQQLWLRRLPLHKEILPNGTKSSTDFVEKFWNVGILQSRPVNCYADSVFKPLLCQGRTDGTIGLFEVREKFFGFLSWFNALPIMWKDRRRGSYLNGLCAIVIIMMMWFDVYGCGQIMNITKVELSLLICESILCRCCFHLACAHTERFNICFDDNDATGGMAT